MHPMVGVWQGGISGGLPSLFFDSSPLQEPASVGVSASQASDLYVFGTIRTRLRAGEKDQPISENPMLGLPLSVPQRSRADSRFESSLPNWAS
jgi:hypothetical protein